MAKNKLIYFDEFDFYKFVDDYTCCKACGKKGYNKVCPECFLKILRPYTLEYRRYPYFFVEPLTPEQLLEILDKKLGGCPKCMGEI